MKGLNPTYVFTTLVVLLMFVITVWSGRDFKVSRDGLELTHPPVMLDQEQ